jgi:hypothetical protein
MINPEHLHEHAQRIRASGVLGRSELLARLFDFFIACSLKGHTPKEIEVALDVFGKRADFDVAQDAVVRVYIHKLRRKLDEYYQGPGKDEQGRLVMPKGEYRFAWQDAAAPEVIEPEPDVSDQELHGETELALDSVATEQAHARPERRWMRGLLMLVSVLLLVNLAAMWSRQDVIPETPDLHAVRSHPLWAGMLDDDLPVYIVVGDYYIFGELSNKTTAVQRLVREFNINSATDLEQYLKNNPELADRYMDMALKYLPTSVAFALRDLMPVLEPNKKRERQVQVILASNLTPAMTKSAHIVYIGLISGMGILRELVFSHSQLALGDSYDELIDLSTKKHYVSQASMIPDNNGSYTDYGLVFHSVSAEGTQLLVLAGTRDVALMHVAEVVTHEASLQQLSSEAGGSNFEALYSVDALEGVNLGGHLLLTYSFNPAANDRDGDAANVSASTSQSSHP